VTTPHDTQGRGSTAGHGGTSQDVPPETDAILTDSSAVPGSGERLLDARQLIEQGAALYFDRPGRVIELRALGVSRVRGKGVVSGYFDNVGDFVEAATRLDGRAKGVYAMLNLVSPEVLARARNRVLENPERTTQASDVVGRVRLLIDIDPTRRSGISSSDVELDAAKELAREVVALLDSMGFPPPARAISGNGIHVVYAIDLPVSDGDLVNRCLAALAFRFNSPTATIDETVDKPAQLGKVYGTLARKGDALSDRPHRRSRIKLPDGGLRVVSRELLERLADQAPRVDIKAGASNRAPGGKLDVESLLRSAGVEVSKCGPWASGTRWVLRICPFDDGHADGAAYVVQFANGALAAVCLHASCRHWGWRDLRIKLDPSWQPTESGSSAGFAGGVQGPNPDIWGEPQPIPSDLLPVLPMRPALVPSALRDWLVDIADRIQCPLDYPVIGAVVALSSLLGRRVGIKPMRFDDWWVVPNLWGAIIGRPGVMKSPPLKQVLRLLVGIERDAFATYQQQLQAYEAAEMAWKKRRDRVGGKEVDDLDDDELAERAKHVVAQKPVAPCRPRNMVNDPSHEKLGEILRDNPNGVLVFRDELVGLLHKLDKDGNEEARTFYLEGWDGDGSYTFDRIGRGTVHVPHLILSLLGGVQPGPLLSYMHANVRSGVGDDGLIQRFQVTAWPDPSPKWLNIDRYPDSDARRAAEQVFRRLASLTARSANAEVNTEDPAATPWLRFDDEAQERFYLWREKLEVQVRAGGEPEALESHFSKYRSLIPSLALLFHLIDVGQGPVGLESLERAIAFGEYLESHARRTYGAALNSGPRTAAALAKRLTAGSIASPFTLKSVYDKGWSGLTDVELVRRGLGILVELGWLQCVERRGGIGRPTSEYHVNPRVPKSPAASASETSETPVPPTSAGFAGDEQPRSTDIARDWEEIE